MPTTALTGMTGAQPTYTAPTAVGDKKQGTVGKQDFLKLLTAQLRSQDPGSPTDMSQMTQQMTQFSIVEQLISMNEALTAQTAASSTSQALSLLGKNVTWEAEDGSTQTGVVEHVAVAGATPMLHIGGKEIEPGMVSSVS